MVFNLVNMIKYYVKIPLKEKNMKKIKLQLHTRIALLIICVILISIVNTAFFITRWRMANIREDIENNIMNVAQIVANAPVVKDNIEKINGEQMIQQYIENILRATDGIDVIVAADMNGIRYGHPNPSRVGEKFVGGDEGRVLKKTETYISEAEGTLGEQIRAFVPVFNKEGKQVGFVMAGKLIGSIKKIKNQAIVIVIASSIGGVILGVLGAFLLGTSIKKTLLGLEPEQISKLYIEKKEILEAMQEGIIAIDDSSKITLINKAAIKMLKLYKEGESVQEIIGRDINEIFPTCRLPEILLSKEEEKLKEQVINDTIVLINRVPVRVNGKVIGAIATFNDKTMVTRLAEEVTGVKQIVEALRANSHEFSNKLHVILGLIQLGRIDEAKKYIMSETDKHQNVISFIMKNIQEPAVAALILGKISRAKELGIAMSLSDESNLSKIKGRVTSGALITIIGNLLENAMDELGYSNTQNKEIKITITESKNEVFIVVEDSGEGIKRELLPSIFQWGFSTKDESRGRGLPLIKDTIENLKGSINFVSTEGKGTVFSVILPKEGDYYDKSYNS